MMDEITKAEFSNVLPAILERIRAMGLRTVMITSGPSRYERMDPVAFVTPDDSASIDAIRGLLADGYDPSKIFVELETPAGKCTCELRLQEPSLAFTTSLVAHYYCATHVSAGPDFETQMVALLAKLPAFRHYLAMDFCNQVKETPKNKFGAEQHDLDRDYELKAALFVAMLQEIPTERHTLHSFLPWEWRANSNVANNREAHFRMLELLLGTEPRLDHQRDADLSGDAKAFGEWLRYSSPEIHPEQPQLLLKPNKQEAGRFMLAEVLGKDFPDGSRFNTSVWLSRTRAPEIGKLVFTQVWGDLDGQFTTFFIPTVETPRAYLKGLFQTAGNVNFSLLDEETARGVVSAWMQDSEMIEAKGAFAAFWCSFRNSPMHHRALHHFAYSADQEINRTYTAVNKSNLRAQADNLTEMTEKLRQVLPKAYALAKFDPLPRNVDWANLPQEIRLDRLLPLIESAQRPEQQQYLAGEIRKVASNIQRFLKDTLDQFHPPFDVEAERASMLSIWQALDDVPYLHEAPRRVDPADHPSPIALAVMESRGGEAEPDEDFLL